MANNNPGGYGRFIDKSNESNKPKKKKPLIVTEKQLNAFREKTNNPKAELRDYLNAKQGLTRRKDKAKPVKQQVIKPTIIKDPRSDEPNYTDKRADADNYVPSKSTKSDSSKVKGTTNVKTERKKNKGVFGFKRGGVVSKGGSVRKAAKKKSIDGIAKKGKTKGRII